MAALSARCVRSLARVSIQISVSYLDKQARIYERNVLMQEIFFFFTENSFVYEWRITKWVACSCAFCIYTQAYVTYVSIASKLKCLNWLNFSFSFSARSLSSALGKSILRDCGL